MVTKPQDGHSIPCNSCNIGLLLIKESFARWPHDSWILQLARREKHSNIYDEWHQNNNKLFHGLFFRTAREKLAHISSKYIGIINRVTTFSNTINMSISYEYSPFVTIQCLLTSVISGWGVKGAKGQSWYDYRPKGWGLLKFLDKLL